MQGGSNGRLAPARRLILRLMGAYLGLRHRRLRKQFFEALGNWPEVAAPRSYHERMLWRKIFDHNRLFVTFTDKLAAKSYIAARLPGLKLPATLWSGRRPEEIPPELLSEAVVIKTNHASGNSVFIENGTPDRAEIVARLTASLAHSFGRGAGEWAYRRIARRVFVEERLSLGGGDLPTEIKVHVCGGKVAHVWIEDKQRGLSATLDAGGRLLPGRDSDYPRADQAFPVNARVFELVCEAMGLALRLADDIDYLRIDFLVTEAGLHGGELTVYSGSGHGTWENPAVAERMARLWDLRRSAFMRRRYWGLAGLYAAALAAEYDDDKPLPGAL